MGQRTNPKDGREDGGLTRMLKISSLKHKANRNPKCMEIILFNTWCIFLFWTRRGKFHQLPKIKIGQSSGILA
jgi:hypothetical protein